MKEIEKIIPQEGQESVWDYPRPPIVAPCSKHIQVFLNDIIIVDSIRTLKMVETSHPPSYYIPKEDIQMQYFEENKEISFCEYKGKANYYNFKFEDIILQDVAWTYLKPSHHYVQIKDYLSFYPNRGLLCKVDGEIVTPQEGEFYGGWITKDIVGPFKGGSGTWGW